MVPEFKNHFNRIRLPLTLLFVYILLFEFILPVNRILPKPSLLWESGLSIWQDYNLINPLIVTLSVVYSSIIISYLILNFAAGRIIGLLRSFPGLAGSLGFTKYFPLLPLIVIIEFWFPVSLPVEYLFGVAAAFAIFTSSLSGGLTSLPKHYIDAASSIGFNENKINSAVIWKSLQPEVFAPAGKFHAGIWGTILVFEFVNFSYGLGSVYFRMLNYSDFAGVIALTVIIAVLICLGNMLIQFLKNKIIFWES